ncbi:hypothetical protein HPP92_024780 [Vanilla planifolia]|uniref:Uncharacterized protein n=1 Tax=Vanilla planifolia TaxID=51239 RepID=A0A835UBP7_VANPL|nr:hypothetical protein HPP92_024780 [Vanilla planifolia]
MSASSKSSVANTELDISQHASKCTVDLDSVVKTPIVLPMKRKFVEVKDPSSTTPTAKRLAMAEFSSPPGLQNSSFGRRNSPAVDGNIQYSIGSLTPRSLSNRLIASSIPVDNDDTHLLGTSGAPVSAISQSSLPGEQFLGNTERMTLDSLVVQYLKHQHRQCPAPITTLPPLSLLHSHVCPEPSRSLNAPANVTARVGTCELGKQHRGIHTSRRDRQFVYSRFRPCRTCRDDVALLTSITFWVIPTTLPPEVTRSSLSVDTQLILSSGSFDVKLWDASSVSNGPFQTFDGCKTARFSHAGTSFAALSTDASSREVLLYDIQTCNVELKLSDTSSNPSGIGRGHTQSLIHFSPLDTMLLWNGVLWDRRSAGPLHRFDQFTDYGGGGFHPSGNEVILNSEVWDLLPGDVIYAILRRNLEDVTSAVNTRRGRHPLFPAFRTIDATNYCDIATVQVDRCVLDFAADPTDSYVGVIAMDDHEDMFSSARLYEIGRRRPTDDDSDPDDGGDTDDEEDEEDDTDADIDEVLGGESDIEGDSDSEDASNDEDDEDIESGDEMDEEADFNLDDVELEGRPRGVGDYCRQRRRRRGRQWFGIVQQRWRRGFLIQWLWILSLISAASCNYGIFVTSISSN